MSLTLDTKGNLDLIIILVVQWIITILTIIVMTISIVKDKPHLWKIVSNLVLMRQWMPLLNFEGRRQTKNYI
jgi:hypothetical protein